MVRKRRFVSPSVIGAMLVVGAVPLSVWLFSGHGRPAARIVRVGEIQALAAGSRISENPNPMTGAPPTSRLLSPTGTRLGAPDHLTGTVSLTSVSLRWHPVAGAAGHVIYRDGKPVGETTGLSFDDNGLHIGVPHTWTVATFDRHHVLGDQSATLTLIPGQ